jgi:predicted nucleic acid-binding protein
VSLYVDTSCLLKLFFEEPETGRTIELVAREERVVVSSLARLEALVQIQARMAGRMLSPSAARRLIARIDAVLRRDPYDLVATPATTFEAAEEQLRPLARSTYCRTIDRLHLGAMQALRLRRLLTNDDVQARAARAAGLSVAMPR